MESTYMAANQNTTRVKTSWGLLDMKSFHFCRAHGYQTVKEAQPRQVPAPSPSLAMFIILTLFKKALCVLLDRLSNWDVICHGR